MSIYNKPELKINIGCNTPSFCHKKINSVNFTSSHANRYLQANTKKYITKNPLNLKSSSNINPENNGINYNSHIIQNSNINKVMTSANMKNRRFEIDINKNNSPKARFNKSMGENTILFKNKQSTSQNNINNINYNINNAKQINNTKSKNSMNNINININISKKIISTYYNKTKDKKDIIVKKKSINSLNNSNSKENKNTNTNNNIKYHQINNKKEEKDKEEKENQKQYVLRLKKQAKDIESKQSKKIEEKSLLYKPFINQKVDKTKNYLFMKQYQKFINNEKKLIDKENNFRKNYMKPISNEEIDEFNVKMDKKREEKKLISEEKSQKLQEEWKERKKTIPEYISPLYEKAYEDITNDVIRENANKEQRNYLLDKKKDYSLEVRNSHVPKKNLTLEQKRLTTISNLDPKRFLQYKDTLQHHKRKGRVLLKKVNPNKPNKYDWLKKLNKSAESEVNIEDKLIKKPKYYMLSMSTEKNRNKLPNIKIDYLNV